MSGNTKIHLIIARGRLGRNAAGFVHPGASFCRKETVFWRICAFCASRAGHLAFCREIWYHTLQYAFTVLFAGRIKFQYRK
ncbi:hypothetical protein SUBVAR_06231 [Subdoligranulum variabile DSM 15176]|uniref:Uncharacterized protein n=1 Tax=Subdoligranulum variabile DSM 15176 TaxID=411471 RepID=D1PPB6_9FIRM|nr:hypothetical protein SUBVAR_06231 [Subdoligranulum variabile DSM 15176]